MQTLHVSRFTNIVELKKSPSKIINQLKNEPVAVLSHNTPKAYLLSPKLFESMMEALDEQRLVNICRERLKNIDTAVEVDIETI